MKYRNIELYYQQTLDDVGTKIIDMRTTEPLTAIRLTFHGTNGATSNKSNFLNDVITKIELVDGSDQLISMNMKEAQALQHRLTKKTPFMRPGEKNDGSQEEQVIILFGRYLWDPEYFMDLGKFRNPQLKISTDIAKVRAAEATGFVSGSLKVTVDLLTIPEGAKDSKGFMMQKNIYSFTSGASGDEHIDLPLDYPYLGLLVRAYAKDKDIDEVISKVKINCDAGKYIPIEKYMKDLYRIEDNDFGPAEMRYYIYRKDGETVYHPINHDPIVALTPSGEGHIAGASWSWSSGFALLLKDAAGAAVTTEELIEVMIRGNCLHSSIYLPMGIQEDPTTYFDPKPFGDIDLVLTQAAVGEVDVVTAQLRALAK